MTQRLELLPAGEGDLRELAALERACFSAPWSERELAGSLSSPFVVLRRALLDGVCAGYLCASALYGEAEILRIAVHPDCRRRGIARALLREFFENFPDYATFLEVRASNTAARALYESEGFAAAGVRRNYYEHPAEDAVCMMRPPSPQNTTGNIPGVKEA